MKIKRILAIFVVMAMTVTMIPVLVFADEEITETEETKTEETSETKETEATEPETNDEEEVSVSEKGDLPEQADKEDAKDAITGTSGNIKWSFNETDGTFTVSPKKKNTKVAMPKFEYNSNPWGSYLWRIKKLVISKGITSISDYAFNGTPNMTSVSIPSGFKTIGKGAFLRSGLKSVSIPKTVTSIGESAFNDCKDLETVKIYGAASIGIAAFSNCGSLKTLSLGSKVKSIGASAFSGKRYEVG
jgi:cytoskeletal protein RodZ